MLEQRIGLAVGREVTIPPPSGRFAVDVGSHIEEMLCIFLTREWPDWSALDIILPSQCVDDYYIPGRALECLTLFQMRSKQSSILFLLEKLKQY